MTQAQLSAMNLALSIYLETITAAGEDGIPSGHIYAALMGQGITLNSHNAIIGALVKTGKITNTNHLLRVRLSFSQGQTILSA